MNSFDASILLWCGHLAAAKPALAQAVYVLNGCVCLKGDLFMAVCFWLWFSEKGDVERRREVVVGSILAAFVAIVVGRELATHLPYRERPVFNPAYGLPVALVTQSESLRNWSAFPSDHAVLFSAISTGFLFISPALGVAAHLYWLSIVGLPRVFLGLHHPTDVLGGGAIGAIVGLAVNVPLLRRRAAGLASGWRSAHPASFYAAVFLVLAEIGTMFSDVRGVLSSVALWAGLAK